MRPQSVRLGSKVSILNERKSNALRPKHPYQRQERLTSSHNAFRSSFFQSTLSRVPQNDLGSQAEPYSLPKDRSSFKTFSKSFRDSFSKDFKIGTLVPSPPQGMTRVKSSGKFAFGSLHSESPDQKDSFGIIPEVGRRNPYLTKSLHKLKKIGFPEKNIKALVQYANQNDRQLIKGVSRVARSDPDQVLGNIETLLYERKQVEAIDQWEDQQKLRRKVKSAFENLPRCGTAS